jgi:small subunit ribosomal protein S8
VERPFVIIRNQPRKRGVADVLKREGFIWDWKEEEAQQSPVSTYVWKN